MSYSGYEEPDDIKSSEAVSIVFVDKLAAVLLTSL